MLRYKMLVLTDHTRHSKENSLYGLLQNIRQDDRCAHVDVATRKKTENHAFFLTHSTEELLVSEVDEHFAFEANGHNFEKNNKRVRLSTYDVVWLRMPPPLSMAFLAFLEKQFPEVLFINDPQGIQETGSKAFLLNFPALCPPMKICRSIGDIVVFKNEFPIVLKPFREYGGRGIIKIDGDQVWEGDIPISFADFIGKIESKEIEYLAVKFLKNVSQGDKRIVVVHGQVMGASLRLPPKGSWICNVAMGGSSNDTKVNEEEQIIINQLNPILKNLGIVMYGIDTLVAENGQRVLSEINTTSIGGLVQIEKLNGTPVLKVAASLIWDYIYWKKNNK
ncbi:MAG: glutathione synthetase [Saprospiraceae bacterium]